MHSRVYKLGFKPTYNKILVTRCLPPQRDIDMLNNMFYGDTRINADQLLTAVCKKWGKSYDMQLVEDRRGMLFLEIMPKEMNHHDEGYNNSGRNNRKQLQR